MGALQEDLEQVEGRKPGEMTKGGETRVVMTVGGAREHPGAGGARRGTREQQGQ